MRTEHFMYFFCIKNYIGTQGEVCTVKIPLCASCLVLPCSLSVCFVCPFSILITLLAEEEAGLCAHRAFVC